MNVQQSKQMKIILASVALVVAFVFACLPQTAFAEEVGANAGQADGQSEGLTAQGEEPEGNGPQASQLTGQTGQSGSSEASTEGAVEQSGNASEPQVGATENSAAATGGEAEGANLTAQGEEQPDLTASGLGDTRSNSAELSAQASFDPANVHVEYRTHVQNDGWQGYVKDGAMSGTQGRSLRLEGINIKLTGLDGISGSVVYQTHVQYVGWQDAVSNGAMSGTSGQSLRLEGIRIWLTGDIATYYDVYYRTHVQNDGWQDWRSNGAMAGTSGRSLRLEGIEIKLVRKAASSSEPSVSYQAHVQNIGWQSSVSDGATAGTSGQSLRVEAVKITLNEGRYSGAISYQAHVQNIGWQQEVSNGAMSGTSGKSLRVEAFKIWLEGDIANYYDVYYRTHVQYYGWLDWACNGAESGSDGKGLRMEALEIVLVAKGGAAPGSTEHATVNSIKNPLNGIDISSWQSGINLSKVSADFVIVKATGGTGYTNPYYQSQANAALNSGKLLGLYHFARESGYRGTAKQEATYFVKQVKAGGYDGDAILVLDWESEAISCGVSWAKEWLDEVYRQTGVRAMIYMSKSVTREYDWSSVASNYKLWVAQYPDYEPTGYQDDPWTDRYGYGAWSSPTMFQYASTGRLSGYSGNLDLDKFYGSETTWKQIASKS